MNQAEEPDDDGSPTASMTMAELDAFVESRRATMPKEGNQKKPKPRAVKPVRLASRPGKSRCE